MSLRPTNSFNWNLLETLTVMSLFRPDVDRIAGYVPGEQPQESGWIKLNTNENPYAASPRVVAAVKAASEGRLNVYPDPLVHSFCQLAADHFDLDPEWFLPANGSDENLTILLRSFVDPGEQIAYPYPSYVLYETLAQIQGASYQRILLNPDWSWNEELAAPALSTSKMLFVPNPNSPSGNRWSDEIISKLQPKHGMLVLDEAYGDFSDHPHRAELLKSEIGPKLIITRTMSKSYSLAGIRFGFAIAHPDWITGMRKVKDSYNCDCLSIAAAVAALKDQDWLVENTRKIQATRIRAAEALDTLGFDVVPSQANFLWVTKPDGKHQALYSALKARKILIRYMPFPHAVPQLQEGLRITIGTDDEMDSLLEALQEILT